MEVYDRAPQSVFGRTSDPINSQRGRWKSLTHLSNPASSNLLGPNLAKNEASSNPTLSACRTANPKSRANDRCTHQSKGAPHGRPLNSKKTIKNWLTVKTGSPTAYDPTAPPVRAVVPFRLRDQHPSVDSPQVGASLPNDRVSKREPSTP